ncbi:MAG: hypothetical protein ACLRNZ_07170 [Blautia massiliensis (ex Durand et al. 2017)]
MEKLLDEIESYWSTRTEGYSEVNHKELAGTQKNAWLKVLTSQFPDKPKEEIRILDIGTGPGFFSCDPGRSRISCRCSGLYGRNAGKGKGKCRRPLPEYPLF